MDLENILNTIQPFLVLFVAVFAAFLTATWISSVIWAFRDIRARTRDIFAQVLATLMVLIFFPLFPLPGLALYLILRPRETLAEARTRHLAERKALAGELQKAYAKLSAAKARAVAAQGVHELEEENRRQILSNGARILTATHALSGVERAIRKEFGTIEPLEIIANTFRLFGEGTKVCVEIVLMAADAGLIPVDREVITIAGSGRGADTALLIKPANASRFFELEVREVIAKPRRLE